jgi:hypothetical protein
MKEYKFRGQTVNGEWVYGLLTILKRDVNGVKAGTYISNSIGMPLAFLVRPETVGQFISLLDKDGKEIYEGDVYRMPENTFHAEIIAIVSFHNACFLLISNLSGSSWNVDNPLKEMEYLGNIHDNPELIGRVKW